MPNIKIKLVGDLKPGLYLVNLGELLEIEERDVYFELVIFRMKEKQVFKFEKDTELLFFN